MCNGLLSEFRGLRVVTTCVPAVGDLGTSELHTKNSLFQGLPTKGS